MSEYCEKHETEHLDLIDPQRLNCPDCEHERLTDRIAELKAGWNDAVDKWKVERQHNAELEEEHDRLKAESDRLKAWHVERSGWCGNCDCPMFKCACGDSLLEKDDG